MYADATKIYDSGADDWCNRDQGDRRLHRRCEPSFGSSSPTAATTSLLDHADWAEARIECGSGGGGGDTTPPTITARTPAGFATGVAVAISPTATFSEAMNPSTLTTSTFTLVQQGQSTPLAATVSYASQVATLDPTANLAANTTYTATVKGGSSGAKDVAGNPLAADVNWTFTTAAGGQATSTYLTDLTWTLDDERLGPGGEGQVER